MIYSCFDIGGTAIKFGLIDETGRFRKKGSLPTEAQTEGGPGIVHKVCSLIQRQLTDHPLEGIGLSTAGIIDTERGSIDKNQVKELRSIFDNDKQGHKYTLWLHRYFHGDTTDVESLSNDELRNKVQELKNVELSENKDWNDDLKVSCGIYTSTDGGQ